MGPNAPFTTLGGLDYNWVQGRRAARFQINDSLAWITGRHEFKFGVSSRRLRLNDYDFSTYARRWSLTRPCRSSSTASLRPRLGRFHGGVAAVQLFEPGRVCGGHHEAHNVDLDGRRPGGHNSNPESPHNLIARLAGSFDALAHNLNQPLKPSSDRPVQSVSFDTVIVWQPRTALAWQFKPDGLSAPGSACSAISCPAA